MKRSFAEGRYSPWTGMDRSEWEIILEHLIRMGYIAKEEPVSDTSELMCCLLDCITFALFAFVVSPLCECFIVSPSCD
jgi:hypothetical protein